MIISHIIYRMFLLLLVYLIFMGNTLQSNLQQQFCIYYYYYYFAIFYGITQLIKSQILLVLDLISSKIYELFIQYYGQFYFFLYKQIKLILNLIYLFMISIFILQQLYNKCYQFISIYFVTQQRLYFQFYLKSLSYNKYSLYFILIYIILISGIILIINGLTYCLFILLKRCQD